MDIALDPDAVFGTEAGLNPDAPLSPTALNRLKWRCRRGLLENDLLLERFFQEHRAPLTCRQGRALAVLMALPDNDLLDLFLVRKQPQDALDQPDIREMLSLIRPQGATQSRGNV